MNNVFIGIILTLLIALGFVSCRPDPGAAERAELSDKLAACKAELGGVVLANENANRLLTELKNKHDALIKTMAAQQAAAEESEQRYLELETEFLATEQMNKRYLDELRTRDPVAAEWLATGVDHAVACRLWPEADYCQGTLPR